MAEQHSGQAPAAHQPAAAARARAAAAAAKRVRMQLVLGAPIGFLIGTKSSMWAQSPAEVSLHRWCMNSRGSEADKRSPS